MILYSINLSIFDNIIVTTIEFLNFIYQIFYFHKKKKIIFFFMCVITIFYKEFFIFYFNIQIDYVILEYIYILR